MSEEICLACKCGKIGAADKSGLMMYIACAIDLATGVDREKRLCERHQAMMRQLFIDDQIRAEMVQPVPAGGFAPLDRIDKVETCRDCAATYGLMRLMGYDARGRDAQQHFHMMRVAVGNDRQEHLRLPTVAMGLVLAGIEKYVRPFVKGQENRRHA